MNIISNDTCFISPWSNGQRTVVVLYPKVSKIRISVEDQSGRDIGKTMCSLAHDFRKFCSEIVTNCELLGWSRFEDVAL